MNMTLLEIFAILRELVIYYDLTNAGTQLHTFRVFDNREQLNAENLGASMEDFEQGFYWNRTFANSGYNQEAICKEYGVLGIQWNDLWKRDYCSGETEYRMELMLFDTAECEDCPQDTQRTDKTVDIDITSTLLNIIQELLTYGKYTDGTDTVWMSAGRAVFLNGNGGNWMITERITTYIKQDSINPVLIATGVDKTRGILTPITFVNCTNTAGKWKYDQPNIERIGHVLCSVC